LEKLRAFDSMIDLAKAGIQLRIFLLLAEREKATIEEIKEITGERSKTLLDALRKLRIKGLVKQDKETGECYLTEKGLWYLGLLKSALGIPQAQRSLDLMHFKVINLNDTVRKLTYFKYLYDTVIALGVSPRGELTLRGLAAVMGLSEERALTYIEAFDPLIVPSREGPGKYNKRSPMKRYRLSSLGFKAYKRLPYYGILKRRRIAFKLLRYFLRGAHPRIMLRRLLAFNVLSQAMLIASLYLRYTMCVLLIIGSFTCLMNFLALRIIP